MKWISVKDRMPEPFETVLMFNPGEDPLPTVNAGYFPDDENLVIFNGYRYGREAVTHWMPLPKPPEQFRKEFHYD